MVPSMRRPSINLPYRIEIAPGHVHGPKMLALANERQRKFVLACVELGDNNWSAAARLAGYEGDDNSIWATASRLGHDPKIEAAIQEEAHKLLNTTGIFAVSKLLYLAEKAEKDVDKIKALGMILNRTGFIEKTEHKVVVENNSLTDAAMMARIQYLAKRIGVDETKLLGYQPPVALPVVDAEFAEVDPEEQAFLDQL